MKTKAKVILEFEISSSDYEFEKVELEEYIKSVRIQNEKFEEIIVKALENEKEIKIIGFIFEN